MVIVMVMVMAVAVVVHHIFLFVACYTFFSILGRFGSRNPPKSSQNRFGAIPGQLQAPKGSLGKSKSAFSQFFPRNMGPTLEPFWDPAGTQKSTKNRPGPKKRSSKWRRKRFLSISCAISVRSRIPDRFWDGLNLQNPIISTVGARFSQNHGFHCFLGF